MRRNVLGTAIASTLFAAALALPATAAPTPGLPDTAALGNLPGVHLPVYHPQFNELLGQLSNPNSTASTLLRALDHSLLASPQQGKTEATAPNARLVEAAASLLNNPHLSAPDRDALQGAVQAFRGLSAPAGPAPIEVPSQGPEHTDFLLPSVAGRCIADTGASVALAAAIPGPAALPLPGVPAGSTAFVFTAMGTQPAAAQQGDLVVDWLNVSTLQAGSTQFANNGLNPEGPATLSTVAPTGSGLVLALVRGSVNTADRTCHFTPTVAVLRVK